MIKALNIAKLTKMMMILLSAVFLLTACSPNEGEDKNVVADPNVTVEEQQKIQEAHSECWQADIIRLLYEALGKASMEMYLKITDGSLAMMMIAFGIWFTHRILKHVGSVTEENIGEVWKEVLNKFFICFVCGYLASSPEMLLWVLNTLIFPIYNAFLEFGSAVLASSQFESKGGYSNVLGQEIVFEKSLVCSLQEGTKASLQDGFPTAPQQMMSCMICSISERLGIGRSLAMNVLSNAGFVGMIIGLIVYCMFTYVKLGFVFYLVDTVFRMAIMTIMLPILIMAFAFEKTKEWTKKGFFIILNSAAFAAFIAILMTTALMAMEEIFIKNPTIFGVSDGGEAKNELNELSVMFICLLLIGFLIISSIGVAAAVSGTLVGGKADPKFQKKLKLVLEMVVGWMTAGASKGVKRLASAAKAAKNSAKSKS